MLLASAYFEAEKYELNIGPLNIQLLIPGNVSRQDTCGETSNFWQLYLQQTIPEPISGMAFREIIFQCKSFLELILFVTQKNAPAPILKTLIQELVEGQMDANTFFRRVEKKICRWVDPKVTSSFEKYFPTVQQALCIRKMSIKGLCSSFNNTPEEHRLLSQQNENLTIHLQLHTNQLQKPNLQQQQMQSSSSIGVYPSTVVRFNIFSLN